MNLRRGGIANKDGYSRMRFGTSSLLDGNALVYVGAQFLWPNVVNERLLARLLSRCAVMHSYPNIGRLIGELEW